MGEGFTNRCETKPKVLILVCVEVSVGVPYMPMSPVVMGGLNPCLCGS